MSKDFCVGIDVGPFYAEVCDSGDINIGVEAGAYAGVGYEAGGGAYCEATYNSRDGFSSGCGVSAGGGVGVETPVGGVYSNSTTYIDSRDDD